jgi:hypothetical protein
MTGHVITIGLVVISFLGNWYILSRIRNNDLKHLKRDFDEHKKSDGEKFKRIFDELNELAKQINFIRGKLNGKVQ